MVEEMSSTRSRSWIVSSVTSVKLEGKLFCKFKEAPIVRMTTFPFQWYPSKKVGNGMHSILNPKALKNWIFIIIPSIGYFAVVGLYAYTYAYALRCMHIYRLARECWARMPGKWSFHSGILFIRVLTNEYIYIYINCELVFLCPRYTFMLHNNPSARSYYSLAGNCFVFSFWLFRSFRLACIWCVP